MELVRQIPLNPPLSKGEKGDLTGRETEELIREDLVCPRGMVK